MSLSGCSNDWFVRQTFLLGTLAKSFPGHCELPHDSCACRAEWWLFALPYIRHFSDSFVGGVVEAFPRLGITRRTLVVGYRHFASLEAGA